MVLPGLMLPQEPISKRDEDERRMVSFRLLEASPVMFFYDDIFVVVTRQTPIKTPKNRRRRRSA